MPVLTAQVQNILSNGQVTEATLAPGTVIEWMALRRGGPNVVRNIRWDGAAPLEGFEFIIDDMNETYTFFVPEICGNVSLVRREPSREAARRAEIARAEAAKAAADKAAADKAAADKAAADKAAADKAAADKAAADKAAADKAAADKAAADKAAADAQRPKRHDRPKKRDLPWNGTFACDRSSLDTLVSSSGSTTTPTRQMLVGSSTPSPRLATHSWASRAA